MMLCQEAHIRMSAYEDGELTLPERIELEQHLQTCPTCNAEYVTQQALRAALKKSLPYFTAPPALEKRVRGALPSPAAAREKNPLAWLRAWRWPQVGALLASVAVLAWSATLYFATPSATELLAREVVASHVRSLMVDHLSDVASSDQHTVKPWFNGKIDFAPTVQDFSDQGFTLLGGRLDYLDQRPVAALVYRHKLHTINVYIWPRHEAPTHPAQSLSYQGYQLTHWHQGGMAYWVISDLNAQDLSVLVANLQKQS